MFDPRPLPKKEGRIFCCHIWSTAQRLWSEVRGRYRSVRGPRCRPAIISVEHRQWFDLSTWEPSAALALGRVGWAHRGMGVDPWCMGSWGLMSTKQYAKIRADAGAVASVGGRLGEEQLWCFRAYCERRSVTWMGISSG
eukprot:7380572-Prymnesium_polylepis.1